MNAAMQAGKSRIVLMESVVLRTALAAPDSAIPGAGSLRDQTDVRGEEIVKVEALQHLGQPEEIALQPSPVAD
jgi:hypothetical protein